MNITPIASGSGGNAYRISDGVTSLLLDAGVAIARIQKGCGYSTSTLGGCLVTHEHGDHVKAAKDLARLGVDIYASRGTLEAAGLSGHRMHTVRSLEPFQVGTFTVVPFDVEHDTAEPLGFVVRSESTLEKLLYVTDTCYIKYRIDGLTHIMIEANYDGDVMERNVLNGRIDAVRAKRTLRSHMSIDTVVKTLQGFDLGSLQQIYLLHLSGDNSIAGDFKRRIMAFTGAEVYVC